MSLPAAYIDFLNMSGRPGGVTLAHVDFVIGPAAEKRLIEAIRANTGRQSGADMLRAFCLAICPELDPAVHVIMAQASAAVAKATENLIGRGPAPVTHDGPPNVQNLRASTKPGACYNCGRYPTLCTCPKGLVPQ
jgi:hypothetical protein